MDNKLCIFEQIETFEKDECTFAICPYRGNIYFPLHKPEEKVRLALLIFLKSIENDTFRVEVEIERYDITLLNQTIGSLIHYAPPALIIETKRQEINLIECKHQLVGYMKDKKANFGLLFNCSQAFFIEQKKDEFTEKEVKTPNEIVNLITHSIVNQRSSLLTEIEQYKNAEQNNDFDAFQELAQKYRRGKKIRFIYKKNELLIPAEGHLFEFDQESQILYFNHIGYDTKKDKRPCFHKLDFVRLEKIYR